MSQVEVPRGRTCSRRLRPAALLASGVLVLPVLAGCSSGDEQSRGNPPAQDIASADRGLVADGGTLRWAVDTMPATLNAFQADADATTGRIAGAVLPALFVLDESGRPQRNPDYLESAELIEREPKQVVLYKLNQQAVWSDGREIGAPDFLAQWRALSGKDSAFWTARNAGYDRIQKIERGANDLEVKVTFTTPYADWRSLFTPLYPKDVTGSAGAFNDGARTTLKATAGPFRISKIDTKAETATLVRNPRWWGDRPKLDKLVLTAVPRDKRVEALTARTVDLADIDPSAAERISYAVKDAGRGGRPLAYGPAAATVPSAALKSWAMAHGSDEELAEVAQQARKRAAEAEKKWAKEQSALSAYEVRKSLAAAYTQLALNGESGPLADDRVRRAIARALDRKALAEAVLTPLGLPAEPPGSHVALAGQAAYTDNSAALGEQNTQEAQALLADAGWTPDGLLDKQEPAKAGGEAGKPDKAKDQDGKKEDAKKDAEKDKEKDKEKKAESSAKPSAKPSDQELEKNKDTASDDGLYIVGDGKGDKSSQEKGGMAGAYAPRGTAAPDRASAGGALGKDGKPLSLRFVLPSGPGSETLRGVGDKIAQMLDRIGVRTEIVKVDDASFFKDHIASGDYDLALYSWPSSPYPATDARPIYAKPKPASDGSLLVEQNYTRVGTDYIDQLFAQAAGELDDEAARDLMRRADARIWAVAGSVPLYQRPELVAVRRDVVNAGAFGFADPRYQDIGFKKGGAAPKK
ncbi:ABC transporter family substrate-binding protein [Streptomyces sp. NPDC003023]|uniref:ABC transporter family substrate-binding protein n=1 Tax=Streptomyces sp. NPDC003023 TaxID=3364675 RepID=UPI0036B5BF3E